MPRLARRELPDGVFHVTSRGVRRATLFFDDLDYGMFVCQLRVIAARFGWRLHAYCLMPNHYHLVVETPVLRLSAGMHRLNGRYAQGFNDRHDQLGHVFEGRYRTRVVASEGHAAAACEYVWNNPVRAGLCECAEDWRWSG